MNRNLSVMGILCLLAVPAAATEEILDLAVQLTDGLEAAHEAGIVHRGIQGPENRMQQVAAPTNGTR